MYCYVDESGNTGLELFDPNQPTLYYGLLSAPANLDIVAEPLLKELRKNLGVKRLHANELGVARLTTVAESLTRFSKKNDLRFSMLKVRKPDHALICFFDQVFDSGLNKAVSWHHYFTPLRYPLLFKVAYLFDEPLAKEAWKARREKNTARAAQMLTKLCNDLLPRVKTLPDARSRELVSGALRWAAANPEEVSYGAGNYDSALQISPNLIGFQQVLQTMAIQSTARKKQVRKITVDRQTEFNGAQGELAEFYRRLRGHKGEMGPGMPTFDYSLMPEVPPTFTPGDASAGLELVDITLWITKRLEDDKPVSPELRELFWKQAKRGLTDEVSLRAIEKRWQHIMDLPEPDKPLPEELQNHFKEMEERRKKEVEKLPTGKAA
ncbi:MULTISPECIES: DUF3800 domain-containing protein [unclassified Mesorhizobium]|uniref:DUF3800 domain-containing protein n=1 Tax=unclassified Mesorhizobium TaxID=325217 RepID=UPI0010926827|nr:MULTISPECIES: DUF3800 domain-containing protein [unclassified Mesorhizobium]TGP85619.1 hypothetical protein EN861_33125 [Mesorhizobium sp. M8A.F.Ca.ET.218.01.1.1]TGT14770.1 hypothetical protein EN856_32665 [Mesorhizobium sp. M8A.F.Ca.ET.213.01.1.1]